MKALKKATALVLCLALVLALGLGSSALAAEAPTGNTYDITADTVKILGRSFTDEAGYTCFSYGAAGVEIKFKGTDLWVDIAQLDGANESTDVMVLVDSLMPMTAKRYTIAGNVGWLQVASGLADGEHFVRIIKMSRGIGAGGSFGTDWFGVKKIAVSEGGSILTPNPYSDLVIEAYGDSITNGDAVWLNAEGQNQAYTYGAYSGVVSRLLGAELQATGNTGNGLNSWCLGAGNLFPPRESWDQEEPRASQHDAPDHSETDVLIINLGTNDMAAIGNTTDPECEQYTEEYFKESYINWLDAAYAANPNIICIGTLGAMGADLLFDDIQAACDEVNKKHGKEYAFFVELTHCTTFEGGAGYDNGHPSNYAHETYGLIFAKLINEKLGLGKEAELNAYEPVIAISPEINAGNLALQATAFNKEDAKVYEDKAFASLTNDGNTSTGWQYASENNMYDVDSKVLTDCWIGYEFSEPTAADEMTVLWEFDTRAAKYTVQISDDGEEWTDIEGAVYTEGEKDANGRALDNIKFDEVTAKYYRINMTEGTNGKNYCPKIFEVEILSEKYEAPETSTPVVSTPAETTSSEVASQVTSEVASETVSDTASSDGNDGGNGGSWIFFVIGAVVVIGGGIAAFFGLKKKKAE